jgi:hypothetical protein
MCGGAFPGGEQFYRKNGEKMKKKLLLLSVFTFLFLFFMEVKAEKRIYTTKRVVGSAPVIDGYLNDPEWSTVEWSGDFTQREPYEGKKPSQETSIKILYDDKNLYVGIRAFDTKAEEIEKQLARRDNFAGDWVEINIDSYYDHRTAFSFTITAAGVKGDEAISNNGDIWDSSWNPVWYAKTKIDKDGWTAEMKIPFTQLRYANKKEHVWGIQFTRRLFRKEERSNWQFVPRDAPGWVHLFGELHGIEGIKTQKQVELIPYLVSKYETFEKEEGNPFATGTNTGFTGGLDGKIGVTSDLTLDFTINPDFGQVEADPSEVNLTAFETFFSERRPFFVEGKNILNYQITGGDGDFSSDNLFYSRRIGRIPHYEPEIEDHEFIDLPMETNILAAVKLTGKTKNGWSIAVLESITSKEEAEIDSYGQRRQETIEPFSNFFVARLQKDYRKGDTRIGGMFTATHRNINDQNLDFLHRSAYAGGIDFDHIWKNKTYYISVKTLFSHVRGSREAILETQESSLRYYQRPDAEHISIDQSRTSLTGHGGTVSAGRDGKGHIRYSAGVTWRSPGLELNDVGYLRSADRIMQWSWLGYRVWKPFFIFRNIYVNVNQWKGWDFGGSNLFEGGNINFSLTFKNYWGFSAGINRNFEGLSTTELRGGPALVWPGRWSNWFVIQTDSRKKIRFLLDGDFNWADSHAYRNQSYYVSILYKPTNSLQLTASSSLTLNKRQLQYVDTVNYNNDSRYIFAEINQKTVAFTFRVDFSITPDLSIQYYGQPFISAGKYFNYKRITDPRADQFNDRFRTFTASEVGYDPNEEIYSFDENRDGNFDYEVEQPNFNFLQFRSNLVVRWEYKPGSTLFLVWSQGRTDSLSNGDFSFSNDMRDLFNVTPHNVFLLKFSYRFNL